MASKQQIVTNKSRVRGDNPKLADDIKLARDIFESFNTWKYKREHPNKEKMLEVILRAVRARASIHFLMYWGKGDRSVAGTREEAALSYLLQMLQPIKIRYVNGVKVTLILTDTHAELNGNTRSQMEEYFTSVIDLAAPAGIETVYLSKLAPFDEEQLSKQIAGVRIDEDLFEVLLRSAGRHCKRYDPGLGAKLYYLQNKIEKHIIEEQFANKIFITYNGSELDDLLPSKLPMFYMYSMGKGTSVKPWFAD
jgi:hypothetical protein